MIETDLMIHVGHGIRFQSHAAAADMTASFSIAAERLEKRMRRHKRKLRDHHKSRAARKPSTKPSLSRSRPTERRGGRVPAATS